MYGVSLLCPLHIVCNYGPIFIQETFNFFYIFKLKKSTLNIYFYRSMIFLCYHTVMRRVEKLVAEYIGSPFPLGLTNWKFNLWPRFRVFMLLKVIFKTGESSSLVKLQLKNVTTKYPDFVIDIQRDIVM